MKKEQKFLTTILIFYWLVLLIATHIPIPEWTPRMEMSDKTMHLVAYMILTLLLWLCINFEAKADWKKPRPWLLSAIIILYSVVDEISQYFIRRSTDIIDFAANLVGIAAGMAMVSLLSSYNTIMVIFTICPLLVPPIVKANLIKQGSILEYTVYITIFAIITAAWIKYLLRTLKNKYLAVFFVPPAATVLIVKIYAQLTGKPFSTNAILIAFASILLTLLIWQMINRKTAI